jgi:hypothetical protein
MRGYHLLPDMDWVMEGRYVFSFSEFMFFFLLIVSALLCFCFIFSKSIFLILLFRICIYCHQLKTILYPLFLGCID